MEERMTPELLALCDAYREYYCQTSELHRKTAWQALGKAVEAYAKAKGFDTWGWDYQFVAQEQYCQCKDCGDQHVKGVRQPGLYINGKSINAIVDEERASDA